MTGGGAHPSPNSPLAVGDPATSALARGLALLESFDVDDGWLGNAELSRRTRLSRPTVSRLCATLVELGYLRRNARGQVRPGLQQLVLAQPLLRDLRIRALARPMLQELANQIGGTAALLTMQDLAVLPVEATRSPDVHDRRLDFRQGASPAGTAAGRALLAGLDAGALADALPVLQALPQWPQWQHKVTRSLQDCATQGYCTSFDDDNPHWRSLGIPVRHLTGGIPLALKVAMPAYRISASRMASDIAPRGQALAAALGADSIALHGPTGACSTG